jgi:hypothetical protein
VQASNLAQAGDAFFALTLSMNMHGRAAAMVTPIGDKKRLLPAESAVSSSGCVGRGRLKSGSSRKKKWKHARLQGAQRREGVCVGLGCRGPECDFVDFLRCAKGDLATIGDGAPPQDVWHRLWSLHTPGSPPTKFGVFVTVCNRRFQPEQPIFGARPRSRPGGFLNISLHRESCETGRETSYIAGT